MKKYILIIDDDISLCNLFGMVLTSYGFKCERANNGLDGFKILENFHPDLILLDLRMPEMDGLTFLELLRNHQHSMIPVLVVSGSNIEDTRDLSRLAGADGQLVKPFSALALLKKVNELLAMSI